MTKWQTIPVKRAPELTCCYVFLSAEGALYAGSTRNLRNRLGGHSSKPWMKRVVRLKIKECASVPAARALESRMIWKLRPEANKIGKRPLSLYEIYPEMIEMDRLEAEEAAREEREFERIYEEDIAAQEAHMKEMGLWPPRERKKHKPRAAKIAEIVSIENTEGAGI